MKIKKILVYVGVALTAAVTGALIASPEFRGKVGSSVKDGMNWIGSKVKSNENTADEEPEPEPEEKPRENNENQNRGGYYRSNKPRYNNNRNNNSN